MLYKGGQSLCRNMHVFSSQVQIDKAIQMRMHDGTFSAHAYPATCEVARQELTLFKGLESAKVRQIETKQHVLKLCPQKVSSCKLGYARLCQATLGAESGERHCRTKCHTCRRLSPLLGRLRSLFLPVAGGQCHNCDHPRPFAAGVFFHLHPRMGPRSFESSSILHSRIYLCRTR